MPIESFYTYDGKSRVSEYTCGMAGASVGELFHDYTYAYNDTNGTMTSLLISAEGDGIGDNDDYAVSDTMTYAYDALQRLTTKTTARTGLTLAGERSYKNLSGNRTTTQVSGYTVKVNGTAVDSYTYTYDNLGNITVVNRNGNSLRSDRGNLSNKPILRGKRSARPYGGLS